MRILFPAHPLNKTEVDWSFADEYDAAKNAGFGVDVALVSEEGIIDRSISDDIHIYRGWMLTPDAYKKLSNKIRFLTSPLSYQICHWFSSWYQFVIEYTPHSTYTTTEMANDLLGEILEEYGEYGFIIKGLVKSLKHRWNEAMFVPPGATLNHARKVLAEYLADSDGSPDVVFRKYLPIKTSNNVKHEFRVFFLNGKWMISGHYYESGKDNTDFLPENYKNIIESLAKKIPSPFFTMDIAELENHDWTIIEIGDGGVSGLQGIEYNNFYATLKHKLEIQ